MLPDPLLCQCALVDPEKRIGLGEIRDAESELSARGSHVEKKHLEAPLLALRRERHSVARGVVDAMGNARRTKGAEGAVHGLGAYVRLHAGMNPFVPELGRDPGKEALESLEGNTPAVLGEILAEAVDDRAVGSFDGEEILVLRVVRDGFRHSAHPTIISHGFEEAIVERLQSGLSACISWPPIAQKLDPGVISAGEQEFLEAHRPQVEVLDAADGNGVFDFREREFQKGSRCEHGEVRQFFVQVPQAREYLWGRLDFIQEEERLLSHGAPEVSRKDAPERLRIGGAKQLRQLRLLFEVELEEVPPCTGGRSPWPEKTSPLAGHPE